MAIVRCANGHYFNDSDSHSCPYCSGESAIGRTIPLGGPTAPPAGGYGAGGAADDFGRTQMLDYQATVPLDGGSNIPKTSFVDNAEYGSTVFLDEKQNSEIKPVRGWLVCTEGEKCGIDFKIHSGRNYVGRAKSNDICFDFDQTISKERCCVITYDERSNAFFIQIGEGTNNIYLNNEILLDPRPLKDNDIVEIGKTKLVFRALCNDKFNY